jgi:arsenate reductase (thioredoxin)
MQGFAEIPEGRKKLLEQLGGYIARKRREGLPANVIVICTHNSRRSHIGQLWLWAAAQWYGIGGVHTFSGGTEATAFNHRSVAALQRAGFPLRKRTEGSNPVYALNTGDGDEQSLFSKKFSEAPNPQKAFAAVMVCSEADAGCPFVPGADGRFSIPYHDPKDFDDTPEETAAYDERVRQMGREMFYAMRHARYKS